MPQGTTPPTDVPVEPVSLADATRIWAKIGWLSFGGPAGQIALMHREFVERRRWISESRFLHALNYCMLLPGPEAQQLAVYIGWLLHRSRGGIIAGTLFVLPGFLTMLVLSALYARYQQLPVIGAVFFGLKAAVLAIVVEAVLRIGRRALKSRMLVAIAGAAFVAIFVFHIPFPLIVFGAGLTGYLAYRFIPPSISPPSPDDGGGDRHFLIDRLLAEGKLDHIASSRRRSLTVLVVCLTLWFAPVAVLTLWLGRSHVLTQEGLFFSKSAVVTFGGAYAVLGYIAQRAVEHFGWLTPGDMLDGLALAETTPGPLIMVTQFIGYLAAYRHAGGLDPDLAALLGAVITTWVTFVPSFLFIFVGAPFVETLRANRSLHAALSGITAAVVGVILNLSLWFTLHTVFHGTQSVQWGGAQLDVPVWNTLDPAALALGVAALVAMLRLRLAMGWTLILSGIVGAAWQLWRMPV